MENFLSLVFVLAIFGIVLIASRKIELGYALFIGTVLLGAVFHMSPMGFAHSILKAVIDPKTLTLLGSIFLILILNETLKASGQMEILVQTSIKLLHDVRLTTFFLPALIGMLPLPGGAYFSAPMVDSTLKNTDVSPQKKLFANYWFRHTGEYINPIYPGIVATAALTGLNFRTIVKSNIWLTITAIFIGAIIVFGGKRNGFNSEKSSYKGNLNEIKLFLKGVSPLLLILVMVILFGINIVLSIAIGVGVLLLSCRLRREKIAGVFKKAASLQMLCMILGIVFFQNVLSDCGAVEKITAFLQSSGIGLLPIIAIVPFFKRVCNGYYHSLRRAEPASTAAPSSGSYALEHNVHFRMRIRRRFTFPGSSLSCHNLPVFQGKAFFRVQISGTGSSPCNCNRIGGILNFGKIIFHCKTLKCFYSLKKSRKRMRLTKEAVRREKRSM